MIIDAHAHVVPEDLPERPGWPNWQVAGDSRMLRSAKGLLSAVPELYDLDARLDSQRAQGVDAEVISPLPQLIDYSASTFPEQCSHINRFVASACDAAPERFYGLGVVALQDLDAAMAGLREIRDLGLPGVEIGSHVNGVLVGDERFLPFYTAAEEWNLAVLVHALPPVHDALEGTAAAAYAMPAEIGLAAASIVSGAVARECPDVRIAFSHGGGGFATSLPRGQFFWGGQWNCEVPDERPPTLSPMEIARRYWYDSLVFDRQLLAYLVGTVGVEQIVLGSDFPATGRENPTFATVRGLPLTPEQLAHVTGENTLRWLGTAARS